eukprot:3408243-Prorocentrum_lima.AAC.1
MVHFSSLSDPWDWLSMRLEEPIFPKGAGLKLQLLLLLKAVKDLERVLNPHRLDHWEPVRVRIVLMRPTDVRHSLRSGCR